jgi:hypothetical protein
LRRKERRCAQAKHHSQCDDFVFSHYVGTFPFWFNDSLSEAQEAVHAAMVGLLRFGTLSKAVKMSI